MNKKLIFIYIFLLSSISLYAQEGKLYKWWHAVQGWFFRKPVVVVKNPIARTLDDLDTQITNASNDKNKPLTEESAKKYYQKLHLNYQKALKLMVQRDSIKPEVMELARKNARFLSKYIKISLDQVNQDFPSVIKTSQGLVISVVENKEHVLVGLYDAYSQCIEKCKKDPTNKLNKTTAQAVYRKIQNVLPQLHETGQAVWKLRAENLKKTCAL